MASNSYQDMHALLRSLTTYAPQAPRNGQSQNPQPSSAAEAHHDRPVPLGLYDDASPNGSAFAKPVDHNGILRSLQASLRGGSNAEQPASGVAGTQSSGSSLLPKPAPVAEQDPREITEWPAALRYVNRLINKNEDIGKSIQKMIANQHDNERQWWASREALLQKQRDRVEGKRKLDEVLRAVGGKINTAPMNSDEDNKAELDRFDLKVYQAATQMSKSLSTQLGDMGIPFFGTKPYLIRPPDASNSGAAKAVTEEELKALRLKMVAYLEDMFKE